jgi:hypothetical protein
MNKLIMLFSLCFFASCSQKAGDKNEGNINVDKAVAASVYAAPITAAKYTLDDATRTNIWQLKAILHDNWRLQDMDKVATDVERKTNELLSECRMSGPGHEALHKWLESFLVDLRKLKDKNADRTKSYISMQKKLEDFDLHFD